MVAGEGAYFHHSEVVRERDSREMREVGAEAMGCAHLQNFVDGKCENTARKDRDDELVVAWFVIAPPEPVCPEHRHKKAALEQVVVADAIDDVIKKPRLPGKMVGPGNKQVVESSHDPWQRDGEGLAKSESVHQVCRGEAGIFTAIPATCTKNKMTVYSFYLRA